VTLTYTAVTQRYKVKETSPSGRTVPYEWSSTGCAACGSGDIRLTKIVDSANKQWEFRYDIMGNPENNLWTQSIYNSWGYLTWWLDSLNWKKAYRYDFETSGGTGVGQTIPQPNPVSGLLIVAKKRFPEAQKSSPTVP
jgi:hypothetical protein